MYEEIMRTRNISFFAFPNIKFSERIKQRELRKLKQILPGEIKNIDRFERENEWTQEYYIIYNSYTLEDKDI